MPHRSLLRGVRVLDLSNYVPGPFATRLLASMGADVLKVEPPGGEMGRRRRPTDPPPDEPGGLPRRYALLNAGKAVVEVDLKAPAGRDIFLRLAAGADVVFESFRPGALARLGLGERELRARFPRVVHCALSGWGATGPAAADAAHDLNYAALSGALAAVCPDAGPGAACPPPPFPPVADHAAGQHAALLITAALLRAERTGEGASVDIAIADALLAWQYQPLAAAARGEAPAPPAGGPIAGGAACYNMYRCADGRSVALAAQEPKFWRAFCAAVGRPEWAARQGDPLPQRALQAEVRALFAQQPRDHWESALRGVDCCFTPVASAAEVLRLPQTRQRGVAREDGSVALAAWVDGQPPAHLPPVRLIRGDDALSAWGA